MNEVFFFRLYNFCSFHAWTKNCNLVSNDEKCIGTKAFAGLNITENNKGQINYFSLLCSSINFNLIMRAKALNVGPNPRLIFMSIGWEEEFSKDVEW